MYFYYIIVELDHLPADYEVHKTYHDIDRVLTMEDIEYLLSLEE